MPIININPVYKYALLFIYNGGDPIYIAAKYGLILTELKKLYEQYHHLFEDEDMRITILEELLMAGFTDEEVSEAITWRDFERYIEMYFQGNAFKTIRNYRIGKTRKEIDVLAYKEKILFCIECKHWDRKLSLSSLKKIVEAHIDRCKMLLKEPKFKSYKIFPLIITLRYSRKIYVEDVLILPVRGLKDFLKEYYTLILKRDLKDVNELELR